MNGMVTIVNTTMLHLEIVQRIDLKSPHRKKKNCNYPR